MDNNRTRAPPRPSVVIIPPAVVYLFGTSSSGANKETIDRL